MLTFLDLQIIIDIESFLMSDKFLVIDSRPYGLFSIFLHTLDCLKWAEDNSYTPIIRWSSGRIDINKSRLGADVASSLGNPKYVIDKENFITPEKIENNKKPCLYAENENDNVWEYYFEPINEIDLKQLSSLEYKINDIFMCGELDFDLKNKFLIRNLHSYDKLKIWELNDPSELQFHREQVNKIIKKYVTIKPHILAEVETFFQRKMKDCEDLIGVHIRGTDKKTEFPFRQLTIEDYAEKTKSIIDKNPNKKFKIYVASDNNEAIIKFISIFGKDDIIAFPSVRMPNFYGNVPICLSNNIDRKQHGKETLIEMLLLAKCQYIIGTDSNLNAAASYYNLNAKIIYLDRHSGKNQ